MSVTFTYNNTTYTVEHNPDEISGLWRQNAMTTYEFVRPCVIMATSLGYDGKVEKEPLFFLIHCKMHGWVQVPNDVGYEVLKHPHITPRTPKILLISAISSAILGASFFLLKMRKKK